MHADAFVAVVADNRARQEILEQGFTRRPLSVDAVDLGSVRTFLAVPVLKDYELIGSFNLCRQEVRPFTIQ